MKIEFQKLNSRLSIFAVYQTWTCSKNICRIVDMQRMPYLIYMQELQISLTNFNDILQKIDNYVTNPTTTKISWKSKLLKTIDKKSLLLRYQFSCFIKDFSYSKATILFFVNIWSQKWHQTREVTLFQERYGIAK